MNQESSPGSGQERHRLGKAFCGLTGLMLACLLLLTTAGVAPALATTQMRWAEVPPAEGFSRALGPRRWHFPADYGPHPDFQTEWWYYTGNLETAEGRPFGFQFTIFRQALTPDPSAPSADSPQQAAAAAGSGPSWRSPQVYSAHFTVSDIAAKQFHHRERLERGGVGLAGAGAEPYAVWLNDWEIRADGPEAVRLQASTEAMAIDLRVQQQRPPVLQGRDGLSQKGPEPGNASYYYSLIQQPTEGSLRVGDHTFAVSGISWKDHEFSTSALSPGTVGWDWFSAQFDDGNALMLYDLRREDGSSEPRSGGRWIGAEGEVELGPGDYSLTVQDTWRSPNSRAVYPAAWHLSIPRLAVELEMRPRMADQELTTSSATYWEGSLSYEGRLGEAPLHGRGYGELTGYADRLDALMAG